MKYLGIDYGTKRIGIALSDPDAVMAFPRSVLENTPQLVDVIVQLVKSEQVNVIVVGESNNFAGQANPIMQAIYLFKRSLERALEIPVVFQTEVLTSREAMHIQGDNAMNDASAAAIILQSYLDRVRTVPRPESTEDNDE